MSQYALKERQSFRIEFDIKDELGAAVAAGSLTTMTLTLYDVATGQKINSRDAQNVLNANNVTVDSVGHVIWLGQPADGQIITDAKPRELHRAVFDIAWPGHRHWHALDLVHENEKVIA